MQNKIIYLIGFMGVGKTTLGKKLAKELNYSFIDVDAEIENKFGISISEYFSIYGENAFRDEETKMLEQIISNYKSAVVSVGGGLPCFNANMRTMNTTGVTCYLNRPAKELFHRLKNSKTTRPLIKDLKDTELFSFIESKIEEREEFYMQAQYKVLRHQQNVKDIIEIIDKSVF